MPKTFFTERDIEDLAARGVISLVVDDDVVLTDLARDKAMRLGIELLREHDQPPSAPERPYITKLASPTASTSGSASPPQVRATHKPASETDLYQRVYDAVLARLGDSVDPKLLGAIIQRVLKNIDAR